MFNKMLVPLDGSEVSESILPWVANVANGLKNQVVLMSVIDPGSAPLGHQIATPGVVRYQARFPFLSFAADEQYYTGVPAESARGDLPTSPPKYQYDFADHDLKGGAEEDMADLEEWLRERASLLEGQGVNVLEEKIVTARDKPSQVILEFAADHGCDCIAMATHDRNFLEQVVIGSVTNEVIRTSQVPVFAVTPEKQPESTGPSYSLSSLMVLLDGSAFAESALPYARDLGRRMGLEIILVRWLTTTQAHPAFVGTGSDLVNADKLREEVEQELAQEADEATRYLQGIANDLKKEGLKVGWEVPGAPLDSETAKLPRSCADSMIVLASHGRSGISRWLEGSVAEDLLRDSGCPVLIIPAALAEEEAGEENA